MGPLKIQLQEFRRRVVAGSFPQHSNLAAGLCGLRFVQADPIRSPARAQDLIHRHRVDPYVSGDLEQLYPQLDAEEGYLFAYGFMPSKVWQEKVIGWANAKVIDEQLDVEVGYVSEPASQLKFRRALETEIEAMSIFLGLGSDDWVLNFSSK